MTAMGFDPGLPTYLDTVSDVRRFLLPFDDECPVRGDLQLLFVLDLNQGSHIVAATDTPPPIDPTAPSHLDFIRELREAAGMFSGAMPITPKAAWEEALAEVRRLVLLSDVHERAMEFARTGRRHE